jgi:hypothetical protein
MNEKSQIRPGHPPGLRQLRHPQDSEIPAWLERHGSVYVHYAGSWMSQVERRFGYLRDQKIRRDVHESVQSIEADVRNWIETWNENPRSLA